MEEIRKNLKRIIEEGGKIVVINNKQVTLDVTEEFVKEFLNEKLVDELIENMHISILKTDFKNE